MERCLYRLAKSPFADRFILKGALLLAAWRAPVARPTMDIDLAGKTSHELEHIRSLVGEVCEFATEPDGIEFTAASIEVQRIKEDADYEGVRVWFNATLAKARIGCWGATEQKTRLRIHATSSIDSVGLRSGRNSPR